MFSSWSRFALFSASSRADSYSLRAASSWVLPASSWVRPLLIWNSPRPSWASVPLNSSCTAISASFGSVGLAARPSSIDCSLPRCSFRSASIASPLSIWVFRVLIVCCSVLRNSSVLSFRLASASCRAFSSTVAFCRAVRVVERVLSALL